MGRVATKPDAFILTLTAEPCRVLHRIVAADAMARELLVY
jgi:hypothetical protein